MHPETLQYLLRASGFERVEIRYREPVPDGEKLKATAVPEDVRVSDDPMAKALTGVARTLDANAAILNRLIFSTWTTRSSAIAPDQPTRRSTTPSHVISEARSKPASPSRRASGAIRREPGDRRRERVGRRARRSGR